MNSMNCSLDIVKSKAGIRDEMTCPLCQQKIGMLYATGSSARGYCVDYYCDRCAVVVAVRLDSHCRPRDIDVVQLPY